MTPQKYRTHQFYEELFENYQTIGKSPKGGFITGIPGDETYILERNALPNRGNILVDIPPFEGQKAYGGYFYDVETDMCYQMHLRMHFRSDGKEYARAIAVPLRPRDPESAEYREWVAHCHKITRLQIERQEEYQEDYERFTTE